MHDFIANKLLSILTPGEDLRLDQPPRGVTMERAPDGTTVIKARMFSSGALPVIFFTLLWNGFCMVFLGFATGLLAFPGADSAAASQSQTNTHWSFYLFFTIPASIGIGLLSYTLYQLFGRCEIRLGADEGSVFRGIGPFGRTQRFLPRSVKSVAAKIEMNNGREITLPGLSMKRSMWLVFALEKILTPDAPPQ